MSDGTRVRLARGEDASVVRSLVAELGYVSTTSDVSLDHVLASDAHRLWVAELDGRPVGYALAHVHLRLGLGAPMVSLDELVVTKAARGQGAGTALLAAARAWAAESGAARTELITARSLESYRSRFYAKHGFREVDSAVLRLPTSIETTTSAGAPAQSPDDPLVHFEVGRYGFLVRDGRARASGAAPCQQKLCFTSVSVEPLARVLYELSLRDDCWFVKLDARPRRSGMLRGRCFLTDPDAVGAVWLKYKGTDDLLCTVQDDEFTQRYRPVE